MTGFLLKDYYVLRKNFASTFMVFFVILILFSFTMDASVVYGLVPGMFVLLVMNLFAYDEIAKWDDSACAMPLARNKIVLSRYLACVLLGLFGAAVSCVLVLANALFRRLPINGETGAIIAGSLLISLLFSGLLLPFLYRFGAQKARPALLVLAIIICGVGTLASGFNGAANLNLEALLKFAPLLILVFFVLSFLLSVRIYEKKEF